MSPRGITSAPGAASLTRQGGDDGRSARVAAYRLPDDAEIAAIVLAEGVLLAVADVRVPVDAGGVLDLVLGHGQHDQFLVEPGPVNRREAVPGAEQARLDQDPLRLPGLVVEIHLADLADAVALGVDSGAVDVLLSVVLRCGHGCLPSPVPRVRMPSHATKSKAGRLPSENSGKQRRDCGSAVVSPGRGR